MSVERNSENGNADSSRATVSHVVPPAAPQEQEQVSGGPADRPTADARPTITAEELKADLEIKNGVVSKAVNLKDHIVRGALVLPRLTFKCDLSITGTTFEGDVDLSFCTFKRGVDLADSHFDGEVTFRAARAEGDFCVALASFKRSACFDDLHVGEALDAEGTDFAAVSFSRAAVRKKAAFCCALLEGGKSAQTQFRGEADFSDAHFGGPVYFSGARFHDTVYFDRARVNSSAFFNCDLLKKEIAQSQPKHMERRPNSLHPGEKRPEFYATDFARTASFIAARIHSSASFSGARFGAAGLPVEENGASKYKADFSRVQIDGTALFDPFEDKERKIFEPVHFHYDAIFWNGCIKGAAKFQAVYFGGNVSFEHAQIGRRGTFSAVARECGIVRAEFRKEVNFSDADIKGTASFIGAKFGGKLNFERMATGGSLYFRALEHEKLPAGTDRRLRIAPVSFADEARFVSVRVRGNAEFDSATFAEEATFARMEVGGNLYFRPLTLEFRDYPVTFAKKARFVGAKVNGRAEFSGTLFESGAKFSGMRFGGSTYFDCEHHLEKSDTTCGEQLRDAEPSHPKEIGPVKFGGRAEFGGVTFAQHASFRSAVFGDEVDFRGVNGQGEVSFKDVKFKAEAIFREARFTSIQFNRNESKKIRWPRRLFDYLLSRPSEKSRREHKERRERERCEAKAALPQFGGRVDLSGCTYERIDVKLEDLLDSMGRPAPTDGPNSYKEYNRQPYTQLIKALRAGGDDRRAEYVYVQQRGLERKGTRERAAVDFKTGRLLRAARGLWNWLLDCSLWAIAYYGVQVERLALISLIVICVGWRVFSLPGAVQLKEPYSNIPSSATINNKTSPWQLKVVSSPANQEDLSWREALKFSTSQFLPVIDIPSGSKWKPAQEGAFWFLIPIPFDVYGSVHRILGAIFVPLLLAALAAALYRRFKSEL